MVKLMNRSYKYLIAISIGIIVLSLIGGEAYYFINKNKQENSLNQQKNQDKNIVEEIFGTDGLKAEVRIKGHQYFVVLIENGIEKNIDYCFENPAGSTRERNSEIGFDCSSFTKLEFSPKQKYLMYFMANSTAPTQKFLYNIKTGKKDGVEDVVFSDDENYFSSCIANDEGSIYFGVIYNGESFYQEYSVPLNYAPFLDCRKTTYNNENNTFTFVFNGDINRNIEYNLDTRMAKEFSNQGDLKNQIDKIKDYFFSVNDHIKYFCASKENNYLLVCQEQDKCIKINNISNSKMSSFLKDNMVLVTEKESSYNNSDDNKNIVYAAGGPRSSYNNLTYKKGNSVFYYNGWEDMGMMKIWKGGQIYNPQTGITLKSTEYQCGDSCFNLEDRCKDECPIDMENYRKNCYEEQEKYCLSIEQKFINDYKDLVDNMEVINNFDCEN